MVGTLFTAAQKNYTVIKFLGKGKSGNSYLIKDEKHKYVLKLIHNEECPYYKFTDKMLSEIDSYEQLLKLRIRIPELIEYNYEKKYLIKQYINGSTGTELSAAGQVTDSIFSQLFEMFLVLRKVNVNIDYFPSNFVIENGYLYYIDYEINPYAEEWDLINWGIYYWLNSEGMKKFMETGDASFINESVEHGIPYKKQFKERAAFLKRKCMDA